MSRMWSNSLYSNIPHFIMSLIQKSFYFSFSNSFFILSYFVFDNKPKKKKKKFLLQSPFSIPDFLCFLLKEPWKYTPLFIITHFSTKATNNSAGDHVRLSDPIAEHIFNVTFKSNTLTSV